VPQQRRDHGTPTLRPPMPRMGGDDLPTVTREERRERSQTRSEPDRIQIPREPERDLRRKHEP